MEYGASRDFLIPLLTDRSDPQPIFTQNGSNNVNSREDVPFAVKYYIKYYIYTKQHVDILTRCSEYCNITFIIFAAFDV